MLLRDVMWKVFKSTGQIEAYLTYCSCPSSNEQATALPEQRNPLAVLR